MSYIGKSPSGTGVRIRYYFTQTSGGATSISGTDDNNKTLSFSDGEYVDVYLNGVSLVAGTDYNTTTANTIGGLSALANGDVVEVVVYDIFTVADTVSQSSGGTFSGAVIMSNGLTVDDDGATVLTVDRASSEGTVVDLQKDGTTFGTLGIDGSDLVVDGPSGHTGLRMTTSGLLPRQNSAIIDNTIDLGSASYRFKDLYLGGGAYVGGTAAVNHLDDYEEGTWTATFAGSSTTGPGYYLKIGRQVFVTVYGDSLNVTSSVTGTVSGLPFTNNGGYTAASITHDTYTNNSYNGYVNTGGTTMTAIQDGTVSGAQTVVGNPKYIMMSAVYYTNS